MTPKWREDVINYDLKLEFVSREILVDHWYATKMATLPSLVLSAGDMDVVDQTIQAPTLRWPIMLIG